MEYYGIWNTFKMKIGRNPSLINLWGPEIKQEAQRWLSAKMKFTVPIDDYSIGFFDELVFKADPRLYEGNIDELYSILEAVSPIFKLTTDNAYSTLLLLVSPDMIGTLKSAPDNYRYGIEYDLMIAIFNFYIPSDYIEYTIHYTFGQKPFLEKLLSKPFDTSYIDELKSGLSIEDNEIKAIVEYNIDRMVYYMWEIFTKREARIQALKYFYYTYGNCKYEDDIRSLAIKYKKKYEDICPIIKEINFIITRYPEDYCSKISRFLVYGCSEILGEQDAIKRNFLKDAILLLETNGISTLPGSISDMVEVIINSTELIYHDYYNNRDSNIVEESYIDRFLNLKNDNSDIHLTNIDIAMEASNKFRKNIAHGYHVTESKITRGYNSYKRNELQVDNQLNKIVKTIKNGFIGDKRTEIIEGKEFSLIQLLKRILRTAAVFHFSKIGAILYVITSKVMSDKAKKSERQKLLMELEAEIEIINEKIEDAKMDGNRKVKYSLMRTKTELENARDRIRYGITADEKSNKTAAVLLEKNAASNRLR